MYPAFAEVTLYYGILIIRYPFRALTAWKVEAFLTVPNNIFIMKMIFKLIIRKTAAFEVLPYMT